MAIKLRGGKFDFAVAVAMVVKRLTSTEMLSGK